MVNKDKIFLLWRKFSTKLWEIWTDTWTPSVLTPTVTMYTASQCFSQKRHGTHQAVSTKVVGDGSQNNHSILTASQKQFNKIVCGVFRTFGIMFGNRVSLMWLCGVTSWPSLRQRDGIPTDFMGRLTQTDQPALTASHVISLITAQLGLYNHAWTATANYFY